MRTLGLCALCVILCGCNANQSVEPINLTARELFDAYNADALAADGEYLDKVVLLSEVKGRIDKDKSGAYLLVAHDVRVLRPTMTVPQFQHGEVATVKALPGVVMNIKKGQENRFPGLTRADGFVIRGVCKGIKTDPTASPGFYVVLEGCEFVSNSK